MEQHWQINETPDNKLPKSKFEEFEYRLENHNPQTLTEYARALEVRFQVIDDWAKNPSLAIRGKYWKRHQLFHLQYFIKPQFNINNKVEA